MLSVCYLLLLLIGNLGICPVIAQTPTRLSLSAGLRYDLFLKDDSPQTLGFELTAPVSLSYTWRDILLGMDTAFSSANVFPGQAPDAQLSSLTDLRLSASYVRADLPVGLIVGMDLNLPVGAERLKKTQTAAEAGQNHDLFEVDNFGEGFNLGGSLGLSKTIGKVRLSLNGAYELKGEYDPTRDVDNDTLDPGDHTRLTVQAEWQASEWLHLQSALVYMHLTPDQRNGNDAFQEGDKLALGGTLSLSPQFAKSVNIVGGLQYTRQAKNKELGLDNALRPEPENSNDQEFFGSVDVVYKSSYQMAWRVIGDLRYYGASDRRDALKNVPYEGRRVRYAFGPGFVYSPGKGMVINLLAKYFILQQAADLRNAQEAAFRGVNLSVGATYTF